MRRLASRTPPATLALVALVALAAPGCGPNQTPYAAPAQATTYSCIPNLDGQIDASEMQPMIGATLDYRVSENVTVDLVGRTEGSTRIWDWSSDPSGARQAIGPVPLSGKWYADAFPTGTFVLPTDDADTLESVYRMDAAALWLLGTASTKKSPPEGETLLVYTDPVALYRFPIVAGASWTSTGVIDGGLLRGLPYRGSDTYAATVGGEGELRLPEASYSHVLPVELTVTATPSPGVPIVTREVSFLFECFGEIARAVSLPGETSPDFTHAASLRRLTLESP